MSFKKIILIVFFSTAFFYSQTIKDDEFRTVENNAFKVGEKLTFDVKYGFVTAGIAVMQIPDIKRISGRQAYHIISTVNTFKFRLVL